MCDDSLIYFFWGENILKWQNYNDGDLDIDGDDFNVTTLVTAMTAHKALKGPKLLLLWSNTSSHNGHHNVTRTHVMYWVIFNNS